MRAPRLPADPRPIVAALEEAGVDYVIIGGWAAVTYGVDRATFDLADQADPVRGDRDRRDLEQLGSLPDPDLPPV